MYHNMYWITDVAQIYIYSFHLFIFSVFLLCFIRKNCCFWYVFFMNHCFFFFKVLLWFLYKKKYMMRCIGTTLHLRILCFRFSFGGQFENYVRISTFLFSKLIGKYGLFEEKHIKSSNMFYQLLKRFDKALELK